MSQINMRSVGYMRDSLWEDIFAHIMEDSWITRYLGLNRVDTQTQTTSQLVKLLATNRALYDHLCELAAGKLPLCPQILSPEITEAIPQYGDELRQQFLRQSKEVRGYGDLWTDEMWKDIHLAEQEGIPVLTDQKTIGRSQRQKTSRNADAEIGDLAPV